MCVKNNEAAKDKEEIHAEVALDQRRMNDCRHGLYETPGGLYSVGGGNREGCDGAADLQRFDAASADSGRCLPLERP